MSDEPNLDDLFDGRTVVGAEDFATFFGCDVRDVRTSAADAGAETLGRSFVITKEIAEEILQDFNFDEDDEDESDNEESDEEDSD